MSEPFTAEGRIGSDLNALLGRVNGFYAFESALHVFPVNSTGPSAGLQEWNASGLWRDTYGDMANEYLFFAEDIFGGQFAIKDEVIYSFDPETGESSPIAESLEGWADAILGDYEFLTGFPVAHEWQSLNGAIEDGSRLIPKRPFVLGGEFSAGNMYVLDSVKTMRLRGDLAVQLRDLPDGATVKFKIVD
ncbi:hypothetical protein RKE30_36300 [Streptomyces sp. Li-HN-5-11]|uniref:hypothetical protein n=1 Tax=Streptomyces sp. Li-HN-5-11 TaxID=3075432 RepID=UPI0028A9DABC|nr:hypothetical protein [Streptomyces sp. Li-HN-5-11]WNM35439.1 hypothetical protein RKE30_36300 [Streptomyces sp. Li-HN-5-11]